MKRFVYTGGAYAEFRGYVFWGRKPTTILDKGTLIAIAKRPDFKEVKDEPQPPVPAKRSTLTLRKAK